MGDKLGISLDVVTVQPGQLYDAIKYQLYQRRPVPVSIFTGLTKEPFGHVDVVGNGHLLPEGQGRGGQHLITAVAHCDRWDTDDQVCGAFAGLMHDYNIPACIAFENTWGIGANNRGYVCISKIASRRVLRQAALMKGSLAAVRYKSRAGGYAVSIAKWIWKAITYPFVFMYDPDKIIQREFEDEGPLDKDAHLSEYERSIKTNTNRRGEAQKQP